MSSTTESSLLSKLESSTDTADILTAFSKYLQPFAPKKDSPKTLDTATLRSLARQFIPFLNKALSILPRRLSRRESSSSPEKISTDGASKLFEVYRLCLDCVGMVLTLLECKPYAAQAQQARLIHCLVDWGMYGEAQTECLSALEKMRGITGCNAKTMPGKGKAQLVPRLNGDQVDQDFVLLIVEIVITLVQCTLMIRSKDGGDYKRIILLVGEASPWFKVLNASAFEKFHRMLAGHLNKIGLYLVEELAFFDLELVVEFCKVTLSHHGESSLKDQMYKFALAVCCSILSKKSTQVLQTIDLLKFVLSFLAAKCEFKVEWTITEFLEVVNKCARSCKVETPAVCSAVGEQLSRLAGSQDNTLVGSITEIYASGLLIISSECQSIMCEAPTERHANDGSRSGSVLDSEGLLQGLHLHFESMREFFDIGDNGRRQVLAEGNSASFIFKLRVIQSAFDQLCNIFLHLTRTGAECDAHLECTSKDNTRVILDVAIATFTLSLKTGHRVKESASLMKHVVSSDWVQDDGLKHLFSSLYNVSVVLYRNKQLKEASKALKQSCKASWNLVVNHCKLNKLPKDLSEISFKASMKDSMDFVSEASEKTAMLLDILFGSSKHKMNKLLRDSFESWSTAESMLENISPPLALVKCWVKIGHKLSQNEDTGHNPMTLYSLLSSSKTVSKRALGVLLEQELLAYILIEPIDPKFSLKMRMEVIETLLDKIYVSNDSHVQKSRALIAKGGQLRELGCENLDECIQCLSDAISLLEMCSRNYECDIQALHLRACAYCLRALCTHERTERNSKILLLSSNFEDIRIALNLWLDPLQCPSTDQCNILDKVLTFFNDNEYSDMFFENMLKMLHHLLDLLSIKGYTEMHVDIYEILIRLFKWKKLCQEEAFSFFWKSRSFGHGLCVSPMSEVFISKLCQYYGELSTSIRFWVKCMQPSRNLLVGFLQSYFSTLPGSLQRTVPDESAEGSSIEDVKCAVSNLMSSVPLSDNAVFLAAYLYYDLSERSITKGEVLEALLYAKKAFQWRFELFKQKFRFTVKSKSDSSSEAGDGQRHHDVLGSFQLHNSVAKEVWFGGPSRDIEGYILTPWNALQCYLESMLQVSNVYEILGESSKAESFLHWGKEIALHQCLPLYVISFSSMLGKLYHKQLLWELAEKELKAASQIMADNRIMISCLKCRMILDSTVHHQLGDLYRSHSCNNMGKPSTKMLSCAIENYRLAFQKLNLPARNGSASQIGDENVELADHRARSSYFVCSVDDTLDKGALAAATKRAAGKIQKKQSKGLKKEKKGPSSPQEQCLVAGHNLRMTRSRYRSLEKSCDTASSNAECGPSVKSHNDNSFACNNAPSQVELASESKTSVAECAHELTLLCNKIKCWHCLIHEALESGSLTEFGHLRWELLRRRNLWQLLISIGKCFGAYDHNHKAHQMILLSVSLLVDPFCAKYSFESWTSLIDRVNEDILRDLFAVEHAILLYTLSRIALQSYSSKFTRENRCQISNIGIPRIFSWLKLAFMLCCEVPLVSQKVSRLLTVVYVLSTSVTAFSQSTDEALSENYWASFFHQASIGIHFNQQLFSSRTRTKGGDVIDLEGFVLSSSDSGHPGMLGLLRLTPKSLGNIDEFAKRFFEGLPCTTIICISIIGGAEAILLREVLCCASAQAWILLSRINSKNQPVILLLPIDSILDGSSLDRVSNSDCFVEGKNLVKQWLCPWVPSIVDEIAPIFKTILKENYSSLALQTEDGLLWWSQRKCLDNLLGKFLQDLEDLWLGPWKYLLLGEWSDNDITNSLENKLMEYLTLKSKVKVHKDLLRVILSRARYSSEIRECGLQLIINKGCYIGGCCEAVSNASIEAKKLSAEMFSTIAEADSLETESLACKSVILVLDSEVQMLPWESLPLLRDEEVYRMPSVGSISATINRYQDHQEQLNNYVENFPVIDPLDSFYLLNPSGDLCETQAKFENWFKDQMFEGKSGTAPPCEELVTALKIHDLFIYLGHGSGSQYIPGHMIKNLDTCAATLLMGCSSGSLFANGCHAPTGTPLSYLQAGSPLIVANLWEVTDKDIDRFSKAMLDAWLRERSAVSTRCSECDELLDDFSSLEISNTGVNGKVECSRNDLPDSFDVVSLSCKHRPTLGSFMGQARKACNFPFLIGASPVCYGVPTGIARKKRDVMLTP